MEKNVIFNVTVCIVGIAILLIHIVNCLLKKNRRKDENRLLIFLSFTAFHFAVYLTFSLIKTVYTSDPFVISFYTIFYIFNNIEACLLFLYMLSYLELTDNSKKLLGIINSSLFLIFIVLDIVNIFTHMFFTSIDGEYVRSKMMFIAQGYQFIMLAIVLLVTSINKTLVLREKIAFAFYCALPLVAIILQIILPGYAIAYLSIIIAIEILFFFVNISKNVQLAEEKEKNKEAQIKIMVSQIQPHFIYNSLSSISTLITIDPELAQQTLDKFTEYLRYNLSSLSETKLIPFEDELKHIKTYVALEKVRFNDRINVEYDIKTTKFNVAPLTIQPIVENSIKHGILQKIEGGTLRLSVNEEDDEIIIVIQDDGVGFDMNSVNFSNNKHIGLKNIKYRIKTMCNGEMEVESAIDKGTKVTVTLHKEEQ